MFKFDLSHNQASPALPANLWAYGDSLDAASWSLLEAGITISNGWMVVDTTANWMKARSEATSQYLLPVSYGVNYNLNIRLRELNTFRRTRVSITEFDGTPTSLGTSIIYDSIEVSDDDLTLGDNNILFTPTNATCEYVQLNTIAFIALGADFTIDKIVLTEA